MQIGIPLLLSDNRNDPRSPSLHLRISEDAGCLALPADCDGPKLAVIGGPAVLRRDDANRETNKPGTGQGSHVGDANLAGQGTRNAFEIVFDSCF
jgi:hypothetical protein